MESLLGFEEIQIETKANWANARKQIIVHYTCHISAFIRFHRLLPWQLNPLLKPGIRNRSVSRQIAMIQACRHACLGSQRACVVPRLCAVIKSGFESAGLPIERFAADAVHR